MPDGVDIHLVKKMNLDPVSHPLRKKKKNLFQMDWRSKCEKWNSKIFRGKYRRRYNRGNRQMSFNRTLKIVTIKKTV